MASSYQAAANRVENQVAGLEAQVLQERERTVHATSLSEGQASHFIGLVTASSASAAAAEETAERERTRAINCEHFAAASDRALGAFQAEFGA